MSWTKVPGGHRMGERGPVVVAVHGVEDTWTCWDGVARRLAADHQVIALDLPWRAGNDYTWAARADAHVWLAEALDALPRAHALVGHSFGGNAILEHLVAGARPECVALVAPFYRPAALSTGDGQRARSAAAFENTIRTGLRVKLGDRADRIGQDVLDRMADSLVARVVPTAFPVFFDSFARTGDLDLRAVTVPTLVLAGVHDEALAGERAVALAADMPAADVRSRPHYTHFCHIEQAAEIAEEIADFLAVRITTVGGAL